MNEITRGDYSEGLWNEVQTYGQWLEFHQHDTGVPSRAAAGGILGGYLRGRSGDWPLAFAEVGFGSAIDFETTFGRWQDAGAIRYTGYEITPQFVAFAQRCYSDVDFRLGGFLDLEPLAYDVTYTRHTLQHVNPNLYEPCLRALLAATRGLCLISWRMPPKDDGHIAYDFRSWQVAPSEHETRQIIGGAGFDIEIHEFEADLYGEEYHTGNSLYVLRRVANGGKAD